AVHQVELIAAQAQVGRVAEQELDVDAGGPGVFGGDANERFADIDAQHPIGAELRQLDRLIARPGGKLEHMPSGAKALGHPLGVSSVFADAPRRILSVPPCDRAVHPMPLYGLVVALIVVLATSVYQPARANRACTRFCISSGATSSLCVATHQRCP